MGRLRREYLFTSRFLGNRHDVTKPKENGGLGIGNLVLRNKGLLGKWWWRFHKERRSLWARVIENKYGMQDNGWDADLASHTTFRSPWKFISSMYPMFLQSVKVQLGCGNLVRFWEDIWVGNESLKDRYPNLFRISLHKNKPISCFFTGITTSDFQNVISWDLHLGRN